MPSVSTQPGPKPRTWLKCRTSSRRRAAASRSRKRFDVSFCRPTGPSPALSCAARASFFLLCRLLALGFVEEAPRHRVARHAHVALGEHHLEEVRAPARAAEHLGAAIQVDAPDAPEALVESLRIDGADLVPVAVEALAPCIERERVMPAQIFYIQHLEARPFHLDDHVGEARDPAAGEHVLADEVIGLEMADVTDEVDQAEAPRLQRARVRLDEVAERIAPGVLEAADRHDLVVLAVHAAEVGFEDLGLLQAPELDLALRMLHLRAGGVVAGRLHAEALLRVEEEAAEAAADIHHIVAGLQSHLAPDMIELGALRLFERAHAVGPICAGVEHQRIVEPQPVELRPERVVKLRVVFRMPQFTLECRNSCVLLRSRTSNVCSSAAPPAMPAASAAGKLPSTSTSPSKYASSRPTWPYKAMRR